MKAIFAVSADGDRRFGSPNKTTGKKRGLILFLSTKKNKEQSKKAKRRS